MVEHNRLEESQKYLSNSHNYNNTSVSYQLMSYANYNSYDYLMGREPQ